MCYQYRRPVKQETDADRARKAADAAIEKARSSSAEPKPPKQPMPATSPISEAEAD